MKIEGKNFIKNAAELTAYVVSSGLICVAFALALPRVFEVPTPLALSLVLGAYFGVIGGTTLYATVGNKRPILSRRNN